MRRSRIVVLALSLSLSPAAAMTAPEHGSSDPSDCLPWPVPGIDHTEGATDPESTHPSTGTARAAMIFVDFTDAPGTEDAGQLGERLSGPAMRWFDEVSRGHFDLNITSFPQWYRMPATSSSYGIDRASGTTYAEHHAYVEDAVAAADDAVDFGPYTLLYVVAPSGSALDLSPAFHFGGDGIRADGATLGYGATLGEDAHSDAPEYGARVLIHETLHSLGLPDLYAFSGSDIHRYAGAWDPIGWLGPGAHVTAWHKLKLGWLDQDDIVCVEPQTSREVTLAALADAAGTKAAVVRTGPTTAFIAENRQILGEDAGLCDAGVLLYTIDSSIPDTQGPLRVIPAEPGSEPFCSSLAHAPFEVGQTHAPGPDDPPVTVEVLSAAGTTRTVVVTNDGTFAPPQAHPRAVAISSFDVRARLIFSGTLTASDGHGACVDGVSVKMQRARRGQWVNAGSGTTSETGTWTVKTRAFSGRYRALAPEVSVAGEVCREAISPARRVR